MHSCIVFLYFGLQFNIICIFFNYSNCSSVGHQELFRVGVCVPLTSLYPFAFWALLYFLPLQDSPGKTYIFRTLSPESAISPRKPCSFYWRTVFRKQGLGALCAYAPGVSLLLDQKAFFQNINKREGWGWEMTNSQQVFVMRIPVMGRAVLYILAPLGKQNKSTD